MYGCLAVEAAKCLPLASSHAHHAQTNEFAGCQQRRSQLLYANRGAQMASSSRVARVRHHVPNLPAFLEWGASDTTLAFIVTYVVKLPRSRRLASVVKVCSGT